MREVIQLSTQRNQELVDITGRVKSVVARSGIRDGLVLIASLAAFLLWLPGTAATHQVLDQHLRPGSRKRNAYSRLFLARLLLTLETYRHLIKELVAAVVQVDQWVFRHHAALFPEPDTGT